MHRINIQQSPHLSPEHRSDRQAHKRGGLDIYVTTTTARTQHVNIQLEHLFRSKGQKFYHRLALPRQQNIHPIIPHRDSPDPITRHRQLPDEMPRTRVPQLDSAVIARRDNVPLVKVNSRDAVVVCAYPVEALVRGEIVQDDPAVRAARDEVVAADLHLADEGGVALEVGNAFATRQCTCSHVSWA